MARKRILFVIPPGYGHCLPLIPLAWALKTAGHEVFVATCGVSAALAVRSGLMTVNVAQQADLPAVFKRHSGSFHEPISNPDVGDSNHVVSGDNVFTAVGGLMLPGLHRLAEEWEPDLIIHAPHATAAPLVASKLGIPFVFHSIGIAHTPDSMWGSYVHTHQTSELHDVAICRPATWIDFAPPSLRPQSLGGILMRYIPYQGAELTDLSFFEAPTSDTITVTFGTVAPLVEGLGRMQRMINVLKNVNARFLILHCSSEGKTLEPLPPNISSSSWVPMGKALMGSRALIHHGGPGALFAALDAGLPQLVMPCGADQPYNAEALRRRGAAIVVETGFPDEATVERLLHDTELKHRVGDLRDEMHCMPAPTDIAPVIAGFAK